MTEVSIATPSSAFVSSDREGPATTRAAAPPATSNMQSLAALWARKYMMSVMTRQQAEEVRLSKNTISEVLSKEGRLLTAQRLLRSLTLSSAQSWSKTETLLSDEVRRHGIDPALINPWEIAEDSHNLFYKCLEAYGHRVTPRRLSVIVGPDIGRMRQKYTAQDPRTLGFVSMQFHYTGIVLLEQLSSVEQALFAPYLKVMDDHLYMPLREAYAAAANYGLDSPVLHAVQSLLPISSQIAQTVCEQVSRLHPDYKTQSGALSSTIVRVSSIRDVEMFQVYLCLCILQDSIQSVQMELFPLCAMLYPALGVQWKLVQEMLQTIGWEMLRQLPPEHTAIFLPYLKALTEMFSSEVFEPM